MTEFNFFDEVYTPKEGVENREEHEFLKDLITQGKKLPGKKPWTVELIDQASNEEVKKITLQIYSERTSTQGRKNWQSNGETPH